MPEISRQQKQYLAQQKKEKHIKTFANLLSRQEQYSNR